MELKGRLLDIAKDIRSGDYKISLAVKEIPSGIDKLPEGDLSISLKHWREKRTLTANAYYWVLVGKIASVLEQTTTYVHNWMLREYGALEMIDGKTVTVMLPDTEEAAIKVMCADTYHLKPTTHVVETKTGQNMRLYRMIKGSSLYDTKEMSDLINGAVIEAKDLGIETMSDEELGRMMKAYEEHYSNRH